MEKSMTSVDLQALSAPFALPDHEFRKAGAGEWLVYMTEGPLIQRLNEVDPCWEIRITENHVLRNTDAPDVVEVFGEMIIKGVVRANVGTDAAKTENVYDPPYGQDRKKVGEKFMPPDEHTTKAATTDLLKRCARSFGVGSYILNCPRLKAQDERSAQTMFKTWYDGMFVTEPQPPKPAAAAPRTQPAKPAPKAEPEPEDAEAVKAATPAPQTPQERRIPNGDEAKTAAKGFMRALKQPEIDDLIDTMIANRPSMAGEKDRRIHANKSVLTALGVETWGQYKIRDGIAGIEMQAALQRVKEHAQKREAELAAKVTRKMEPRGDDGTEPDALAPTG
jgi:hypothetical protein